jgi:succinate-semialdehyde dehydrogenase/glutarate-semialdehyde dehydrogenase
MNISSVDPSNGLAIKEYVLNTDNQAAEKILQTLTAWLKWRETGHAGRSRLLTAMSKVLQEQKTGLARLMATEMGKPLSQGIAEIEKCAAVCDYYAENAADYLGDQLITTDVSRPE